MPLATLKSHSLIRLAVVLVGCSDALMYDVLEPTKLPPKECDKGCDLWSRQSPSINQLWETGKPPADAANHCAQPAKSVDTYKYGSWCRCVKPDKPSPGPPPKDLNHPLDQKQFFLYNNYATQNQYLSFALNAAPPGEPAGTKQRSWWRAAYSSQADAAAIRFDAVVGEKDVYQLYNMWGDSEYQHYLGADASDTGFLSSGELYNTTTAMSVKMIPISNGSSVYTMTDQASGKYISYCDSSCSGGKWLRADYTTVDQAMTVELVPSGASPSTEWGYCVSGMAVPEQINVQIAGPQKVVISFVTFEKLPPVSPPTLQYGLSDTTLDSTSAGVSHVHVTSAGDRTYYMHFIQLNDLRERTLYYYQVRSGGAESSSSKTFAFRSGYSTGQTRMNIYGDMGVYSWNNMRNLMSDTADGVTDLIVHMGDHAYNEGDEDERRADGYMSAFQPILASIPWMPVVGNHEYYSGALLERFLNQTWGGHVWTADSATGGVSTATSALGALLSRGTHHAAGLHGSTPSNTSRYFSVDFGLVHLVALDLNMYFGTDDCGDACKQAQMEWLKLDLEKANANREQTPWVVAMSHFPFYCTGCQGEMKGNDILASYYESFGAEQFGNANLSAQARMVEERAASGVELGAAANLTVKQAADAVISDLMPIIHSGGVDLYAAGHWHYYESLWPSHVGATGIGGGVIQRGFIDPNVTVHVTSGNGGPPGQDNFREDCGDKADCGAIPATRKQSVNFGFGRLIAHNDTHLQFLQVRNNDSVVEDDWTIVQSYHGPRR